jgi:hypothetical protein
VRRGASLVTCRLYRPEQLFAQCLPVDPALEEEYAELVWEVHPDGRLIASVEEADGIVAATARIALNAGD